MTRAKFRDAQGHPITASSPEIVHQLDRTIAAYLGARADTRQRLDAVLSADPHCVLGRCLEGYLFLLSGKGDAAPRARAALAAARAAARRRQVTRREALHIAALGAWAYGDMRGAVRHWDGLLAEYPRDIIAIRVSQFVLSYLGESARMRDTVAHILPAWSPGVPGYGFVLGCWAYALEEAGDYAVAEAMGQRAVELNPEDIWAAHAVAHVREMEGRSRDGIAWITALAGRWQECTNFAFHLRWHEGLFHLDLEEYGRVLELYDRAVRPQPTDEYLDVTNAVSLLWRLEQSEVAVGPRWRELAERAHAHAGDHALVFADLHYLMALAAAADQGAVEGFLQSCERFAKAGGGTEAEVMLEVGLPLARGAVAHRRGAYDEAVAHLLPIRHRVHQVGGSHAQRDLFQQLLIDSAWRSRRLDVAATLLAERTASRPRNLWGWKHHAAVLEALGAAGAAEARQELERLRSAAHAEGTLSR